MRRKAYLSVEAMEGRALLSGFSYTVTTDRPVYQAGQPIEMTFTMTNTDDEPVTLGFGGGSGFVISQDGQTVWQSDTVSDGLMMTEVLQPGQSWTEQSTWDGIISDGSSATTTPSVSFLPGGLVPGASVTTASGVFTVTDWLDPTGASSATFRIQSPLSYTLAPPPAITPFGQSVPFSYTITNTSDQPDTFNLDPTDFIVTWPYGDAVWESDPGAASQGPTSQTLQPGQSLTETGSWGAFATEGNWAGTDVWGEFSVSLLGAPVGLSQEFAIGSPLTQTVMTDQTTYQPGQPVNMTATETNTSDQPITILNTQDLFDVMGYGGPTLPAVPVSSGGPLVTLQPGQSQSFTATWDPGPIQGWPESPPSYGILFQDALQAAGSPVFYVEPSQPPIMYPPNLSAPRPPWWGQDGSNPDPLPVPSPSPTPTSTAPTPAPEQVALPIAVSPPPVFSPSPIPTSPSPAPTTEQVALPIAASPLSGPSPSPIPTSPSPTQKSSQEAPPIAVSHPAVMSPSPILTSTATTQTTGQQSLPIAATLAVSTPPSRRGDAVRVQLTLGNDSGKGVLLGASSWAGEIRLRGGATVIAKEPKAFFPAKTATLLSPVSHATGGAV